MKMRLKRCLGICLSALVASNCFAFVSCAHANTIVHTEKVDHTSVRYEGKDGSDNEMDNSVKSDDRFEHKNEDAKSDTETTSIVETKDSATEAGSTQISKEKDKSQEEHTTLNESKNDATNISNEDTELVKHTNEGSAIQSLQHEKENTKGKDAGGRNLALQSQENKKKVAEPAQTLLYPPQNLSIRTPFNSAEKKKKLKDLMKGINESKDDIENTTTFSISKIHADPISFYPHIVVNHHNNTATLFVNAVYVGAWSSSSMLGTNVTLGEATFINFDTVSVRAGNEVFHVYFNPSREFRNVQTSQSPISTWYYSAASVYAVESYSEPMDMNAYQTFEAIANSKDDVIIRFGSANGIALDKTYKKKDISKIKKMLDLYMLILS